MKKRLLTLALFACLSLTGKLYAQIPDGSMAPDWTLTDINGTTHTLSDYLAQGKMVIIEFSATWCGPCWNYMLTGALEQVWEEHGPSGDNTAMIFYIESDFSTGMADLLGQTGSSQGNWVAAIPFPIIDLQPGQNVASQYQIAYYPTLFAVCSDQSIWELGQVSGNAWSSFINSCTLEGEIENIEDAVCYGDGSITAGYEGGVAPVTYLWNTGYTGATLSNIGAGEYSVKITEAGGKWVEIENIIVDGPESPVGLEDSTIEEPLCNGLSNGSIDIEIEGGTPGYEYDWSTGASTQDLNNVPAGNYSVEVTDDNGCTFIQAFYVDEPDEVEAEAATTPENCDLEDGTITLSISGGTGSYEISCPTGNVFGNQIINLSQGFHTATVEDDNGCIWEESIEIEYISAPEVEVGQGPDITCMQTTTTLTAFASSGTGDFEYEWWTDDGHIVGNNQQQTITVDAEGTYHIVVTDFNSTCQTVSEAIVEANIVLPAVDAGPDAPITCENIQITIQGSGDPLNVITWTTADGNIVSGNNTYTPLVNAPGTYTISVFNPQSGCTNLDHVDILNQLSPANAAFQYQTTSLTMITNDLSTGSNLSGWTWSFGDGGTSNDPSPIHTYASEGTYEVCLSVQNGCGVSQSCNLVQVTFVGSVLSIDAQVNDVLCNGDSTGSIALVVNGGTGVYTYSWTGPDGETYNTSTIEDLEAGGYVVVVTDDQGNSITGGFNVGQPGALQIGSSSVVNNACFGQNAGSITVEMLGGVGPYLYSWNGGPAQPENVISQLPGGTYDVLVTDANGCSVLVGPYHLLEPAPIVPQMNVVEPLCFGDANGSITILGVTGGVIPYVYQWEGGSQTEQLTGLVAGTYNFNVTDANGCIVNTPVTLNEPAILDVTVAEIKDASSSSSNDGSATIQVTGGTAPYAVTWSNGMTGLVAENLLPGEYTYSVVDAHGCLYNSPAPVVIGTSVGISEAEVARHLTITPNPSDGHVFIQWKDLTSQEATISVMTLDGRAIADRKVNSVLGQWDITYLGLTQGMYVVFLKHDEKVYPFKLIVL